MMMLSSCETALPASSNPIASLNDIAPAKGQRLLVTGMTGSGKSYLSKRLATNSPRLLVCDAKGEFDDADPDRWSIITKPEQLRRVERPLVLCRLTAGEWLDWDKVFRWAWGQGDLTVLIDEINHVTPPAEPLFGLRSMITTGRSRGVSCLLNTQRPVGIPVIVRSECERFAVFRLQTLDDRMYMSNIINEGVLMEQPPKYHFWFAKDGEVPTLVHVVEGGQ